MFRYCIKFLLLAPTVAVLLIIGNVLLLLVKILFSFPPYPILDYVQLKKKTENL